MSSAWVSEGGKERVGEGGRGSDESKDGDSLDSIKKNGRKLRREFHLGRNIVLLHTFIIMYKQFSVP